jgi:uncharacterized protein involved in tolerance to divalent cations
MKAIYSVLALLLLPIPVEAQAQPLDDERIAQIARHVILQAFDIRAGKPAGKIRSPQLRRIAGDIARDLRPSKERVEAEILRLRERETRRRARFTNIGYALLKGLGIVAILLLLRGSIYLIGRKLEGPSSRERRLLAPLVKTDPNALAVFVPTTSDEEAAALGHSLVEARLAASAVITAPLRVLHHRPVDGQTEVLLILKTRVPRMGKLKKMVRNLHSNPNPGVYPYPIRQGHRPHIDQIRKATRRRPW